MGQTGLPHRAFDGQSVGLPAAATGNLLAGNGDQSSGLRARDEAGERNPVTWESAWIDLGGEG